MQTIIIVTEQETIDPLAGPHSIFDEVRSNLESVGVEARVTKHPGDVIDRFTKWAADDEAGYDTLLEIASETGLIDSDGIERARAGRLEPGDPGYFEPVNALDLRQDIASWMIGSVVASVDIMAAPNPLAVLRVFTKHHERLLAVLAKHKLIAGAAAESPTAEAAIIVAEVQTDLRALKPSAAGMGEAGKCGNCLMERVEIVALMADGTCPKCGGNYKQGIAPRL